MADVEEHGLPRDSEYRVPAGPSRRRHLMRDKCVGKVKAMTHGFTVEIGSGQLIPDPDGPWFLKSDIVAALESLTLDTVEQERLK